MAKLYDSNNKQLSGGRSTASSSTPDISAFDVMRTRSIESGLYSEDGYQRALAKSYQDALNYVSLRYGIVSGQLAKKEGRAYDDQLVQNLYKSTDERSYDLLEAYLSSYYFADTDAHHKEMADMIKTGYESILEDQRYEHSVSEGDKRAANNRLFWSNLWADLKQLGGELHAVFATIGYSAYATSIFGAIDQAIQADKAGKTFGEQFKDTAKEFWKGVNDDLLTSEDSQGNHIPISEAMRDRYSQQDWYQNSAGRIKFEGLNEDWSNLNYTLQNEKTVNALNITGSIISGAVQNAINFIPVVGQGLFWATTAVSSYNMAFNSPQYKDATDAQKAGIAIANFTIEAITEAFGSGGAKALGSIGMDYGKLASKLALKEGANPIIKGLVGTVGRTLSEGLGEGAEEALGQILQDGVEGLILNNKWEWSDPKEVGYAALVGGVVGSLMTAARLPQEISYYNNHYIAVGSGENVRLLKGLDAMLYATSDTPEKLAKISTYKSRVATLVERAKVKNEKELSTTRESAFYTKYSSETEEEARKNHAEEYKEAVAKDKELAPFYAQYKDAVKADEKFLKMANNAMNVLANLSVGFTSKEDFLKAISDGETSFYERIEGYKNFVLGQQNRTYGSRDSEGESDNRQAIVNNYNKRYSKYGFTIVDVSEVAFADKSAERFGEALGEMMGMRVLWVKQGHQNNEKSFDSYAIYDMDVEGGKKRHILLLDESLITGDRSQCEKEIVSAVLNMATRKELKGIKKGLFSELKKAFKELGISYDTDAKAEFFLTEALFTERGASYLAQCHPELTAKVVEALAKVHSSIKVDTSVKKATPKSEAAQTVKKADADIIKMHVDEVQKVHDEAGDEFARSYEEREAGEIKSSVEVSEEDGETKVVYNRELSGDSIETEVNSAYFNIITPTKPNVWAVKRARDFLEREIPGISFSDIYGSKLSPAEYQEYVRNVHGALIRAERKTNKYGDICAPVFQKDGTILTAIRNTNDLSGLFYREAYEANTDESYQNEPSYVIMFAINYIILDFDCLCDYDGNISYIPYNITRHSVSKETIENLKQEVSSTYRDSEEQYYKQFLLDKLGNDEKNILYFETDIGRKYNKFLDEHRGEKIPISEFKYVANKALIPNDAERAAFENEINALLSRGGQVGLSPRNIYDTEDLLYNLKGLYINTDRVVANISLASILPNETFTNDNSVNTDYYEKAIKSSSIVLIRLTPELRRNLLGGLTLFYNPASSKLKIVTDYLNKPDSKNLERMLISISGGNEGAIRIFKSLPDDQMYDIAKNMVTAWQTEGTICFVFSRPKQVDLGKISNFIDDDINSIFHEATHIMQFIINENSHLLPKSQRDIFLDGHGKFDSTVKGMTEAFRNSSDEFQRKIINDFRSIIELMRIYDKSMDSKTLTEFTENLNLYADLYTSIEDFDDSEILTYLSEILYSLDIIEIDARAASGNLSEVEYEKLLSLSIRSDEFGNLYSDNTYINSFCELLYQFYSPTERKFYENGTPQYNARKNALKMSTSNMSSATNTVGNIGNPNPRSQYSSSYDATSNPSTFQKLLYADKQAAVDTFNATEGAITQLKEAEHISDAEYEAVGELEDKRKVLFEVVKQENIKNDTMYRDVEIEDVNEEGSIDKYVNVLPDKSLVEIKLQSATGFLMSQMIDPNGNIADEKSYNPDFVSEVYKQNGSSFVECLENYLLTAYGVVVNVTENRVDPAPAIAFKDGSQGRVNAVRIKLTSEYTEETAEKAISDAMSQDNAVLDVEDFVDSNVLANCGIDVDRCIIITRRSGDGRDELTEALPEILVNGWVDSDEESIATELSSYYDIPSTEGDNLTNAAKQIKKALKKQSDTPFVICVVDVSNSVEFGKMNLYHGLVHISQIHQGLSAGITPENAENMITNAVFKLKNIDEFSTGMVSFLKNLNKELGDVGDDFDLPILAQMWQYVKNNPDDIDSLNDAIDKTAYVFYNLKAGEIAAWNSGEKIERELPSYTITETGNKEYRLVPNDILSDIAAKSGLDLDSFVIDGDVNITTSYKKNASDDNAYKLAGDKKGNKVAGYALAFAQAANVNKNDTLIQIKAKLGNKYKTLSEDFIDVIAQAIFNSKKNKVSTGVNPSDITGIFTKDLVESDERDSRSRMSDDDVTAVVEILYSKDTARNLRKAKNEIEFPMSSLKSDEDVRAYANAVSDSKMSESEADEKFFNKTDAKKASSIAEFLNMLESESLMIYELKNAKTTSQVAAEIEGAKITRSAGKEKAFEKFTNLDEKQKATIFDRLLEHTFSEVDSSTSQIGVRRAAYRFYISTSDSDVNNTVSIENTDDDGNILSGKEVKNVTSNTGSFVGSGSYNAMSARSIDEVLYDNTTEDIDDESKDVYGAAISIVEKAPVSNYSDDTLSFVRKIMASLEKKGVPTDVLEDVGMKILTKVLYANSKSGISKETLAKRLAKTAAILNSYNGLGISSKKLINNLNKQTSIVGDKFIESFKTNFVLFEALENDGKGKIRARDVASMSKQIDDKLKIASEKDEEVLSNVKKAREIKNEVKEEVKEEAKEEDKPKPSTPVKNPPKKMTEELLRIEVKSMADEIANKKSAKGSRSRINEIFEQLANDQQLNLLIKFVDILAENKIIKGDELEKYKARAKKTADNVRKKITEEQKAKSEEAKPAEVKSEEAKSEEAKSEEAKSEEAESAEVKSEEDKPAKKPKLTEKDVTTAAKNLSKKLKNRKSKKGMMTDITAEFDLIRESQKISLFSKYVKALIDEGVVDEDDKEAFDIKVKRYEKLVREDIEKAKSEEAKPAEAKSEEVKPAEVKSEEDKPAEVKPAEIKPVEVKSEEAKPAEVKSEEAKPYDADIRTLKKQFDAKKITSKDVIDELSVIYSEYKAKGDNKSMKGLLDAAVKNNLITKNTAKSIESNSKTSEVKSEEVKPVETKPAEVKPAKDKPAKDKPAKDKPAKNKSDEAYMDDLEDKLLQYKNNKQFGNVEKTINKAFKDGKITEETRDTLLKRYIPADAKIERPADEDGLSVNVPEPKHKPENVEEFKKNIDSALADVEEKGSVLDTMISTLQGEGDYVSVLYAIWYAYEKGYINQKEYLKKISDAQKWKKAYINKQKSISMKNASDKAKKANQSNIDRVYGDEIKKQMKEDLNPKASLPGETTQVYKGKEIIENKDADALYERAKQFVTKPASDEHGYVNQLSQVETEFKDVLDSITKENASDVIELAQGVAARVSRDTDSKTAKTILTGDGVSAVYLLLTAMNNKLDSLNDPSIDMVAMTVAVREAQENLVHYGAKVTALSRWHAVDMDLAFITNFVIEAKRDGIIIDPELIKNYEAARKSKNYTKMSKARDDILKDYARQFKRASELLRSDNPRLRRQGLEKLMEKIKAYRYWALLSRPSTHVTNLASNVTLKVADEASDMFVNAFSRAISKNQKLSTKLGGQDLFDFTKRGRITERVDAFIEANFVSNGKLNYMLETGGKYSDTNTESRLAAIRKNPFSHKAPATLYSLVFNLLEKEDQFFVGKAAKKYLARALQNLVDMGTDLSKISDSDMEELTLKAISLAEQDYLRNDNAVSKALNALTRNHPSVGVVSSLFIPFVKVTVNITNKFLEYSPIGFAQGIYKMIKEINTVKKISYAQNDSEELQKLLDKKDKYAIYDISRKFGRATTGTLMMALGTVLGALGFIRYDEDKYGVVFQIPGTELSFTLDLFQPALSALFMGAVFTQGVQTGEKGGDAMDAIFDAFLNMTFFSDLSGIARKFNISYGESFWDTVNRNLADTSYEILMQYIPAVLKGAIKMTSFKQKDYSGIGSGPSAPWEKNFWKFVGTMIPALAPNAIDPYTGEDAWVTGGSRGSAIAQQIAQIILPMKWYVDDKVSYQIAAEEWKELTGATGITTEGLSTITINGETQSLSKAQREKYARIRAEYVAQLGNEMIDSKAYQKLMTAYNNTTNEKKKKELADQISTMYRRVYEEANKYTRIIYWTEEKGGKYLATSTDELKEIRYYVGTKGSYGFNDAKRKKAGTSYVK